MKKFITILWGLLIITVITPIAQLCTISVTNHDLETSSVSGWAYGGLFVMVMIALVWRTLTRKKSVTRQQLVILFTMFALAVPVMNLGLARHLYTNLLSIPQHYIGYGVDGYSRAYEVQEPGWFPVVPVERDLAWLKAAKIFEFLRDDADLQEQRKRQNDLWLELQGASRRLAKAQEIAPEDVDGFRQQIQHLAVQSAERIAGWVQRDAQLKSWMEAQGLQAVLDTQIQSGLAASAAARKLIERDLAGLDEPVFYLLPRVQAEKLDRSALQRVEIWQSRLSDDARQSFQAEAAALQGERYAALQVLAGTLHTMDLQGLTETRRDLYLSDWKNLSLEAMAAKRTAFIYRLGKQERKALMTREGSNLAGLVDGVFLENRDQALLTSQGVVANTLETMRRIPWAIWRGPLLHWGAFFITCAGMMLYLAFLLRKRWVERENLAFPLVEIADNLIRHDFLMESADDVCAPLPRGRAFAPVFWVGFAVGLLMILTDAVSYLSAGEGAPFASDLSKTLFTSGAFDSLNKVIFVLSPIMLGIFFLLNLEMSFSVWACYFIFRIVFWSIGQGTAIKDSNYVGFSAQGFPFSLEQLLGAGLCFAMILLVKSGIDSVKQHRIAKAHPNLQAEGWRRPLLETAGLLVFLGVLYGLCFNLGLRSPLLFVLFIGISVLLAIAVARMRAETGFPLYQSSYDFTRMPIVLGLTPQVDLRSMLSYFSLSFLPFTMLFRLLPQQIENFELGRRHQLSTRVLVLSGFLAVVTAIGVGLISLLVMSYWLGDVALGQGAVSTEPNSFALANYSSWVSHFRGEKGLESFTVLHRTRLLFVGLGAAVFATLMICRQRFLKFPLHPMGYLLLLFSMYYSFISPYSKGGAGIGFSDASWLWGSAFAAWMLKKLIIKYGGIQSYRKAKPAAIGLIIGAAATLLVLNLVDLGFSYGGGQDDQNPSTRGSWFKDKPSYSPGVY